MVSSSQEPIRKKRASTSSDARLKTSTPVAGSHVRPIRFLDPTTGLSIGEIGPTVEESAVSVDGVRIIIIGGGGGPGGRSWVTEDGVRLG